MATNMYSIVKRAFDKCVSVLQCSSSHKTGRISYHLSRYTTLVNLTSSFLCHFFMLWREGKSSFSSLNDFFGTALFAESLESSSSSSSLWSAVPGSGGERPDSVRGGLWRQSELANIRHHTDSNRGDEAITAAYELAFSFSSPSPAMHGPQCHHLPGVGA